MLRGMDVIPAAGGAGHDRQILSPPEVYEKAGV